MSSSAEANDRIFTLNEINHCNGVDTDRIYISIDGSVFDCAAGKSTYGPGGYFSIFAGHDITYSLAMNSLKKEDVDRFGAEFDETQLKRLNGWKQFFMKKYELIGKLKSDDRTTKIFSLDELNQYNGVDKGELVYVCVDGIVFDVTKGKKHYGPDGRYCMFAGNDITHVLSIHSLNKKDLNIFQFACTAKQEKAMKSWKKFYQKKYGAVGKLNKLYRIKIDSNAKL